MSALARYFVFKGARVSGYDRVRTPLTTALESEGVRVHYTDDDQAIDPEAQWVVYTPAIPTANKVLQYYRAAGYDLLKRSDVLQRITESSFNICVAGTHGKTTITTLIAFILRHSGYGCNAFLGGISANYQTNFWSSERNVNVVEADEYDRSFLKLSPDIAVITAMDPDHLDIYGTPEVMEDAFISFAGRVKQGGWLLSKYGLARGAELKTPGHLTYSLRSTEADVYAEALRVEEGSYIFDVFLGAHCQAASGGPGVAGQVPGTLLKDVVLHMGGLHNVENTVAAIAVAHSLGIGGEAIKAAVAAFKGVRRRFEYVIRTADRVLVDDYAHHPEELRALITGAKDLFPGRKCTVVFQPHLFSRTKDLADAFAASLDLADAVILLPIYPARELPVEGVSSSLILDRMKNPEKQLMTKEELLDWAGQAQPELLIMSGAGDIDALVELVAERLGVETSEKPGGR
jgi:UDP-N-acetylmuramate--alanine ligase